MTWDADPDSGGVPVQFVLKTAPDSRFHRQGNDLRLNATISLTDALVGFSTEVIVLLLCCWCVLLYHEICGHDQRPSTARSEILQHLEVSQGTHGSPWLQRPVVCVE